MSSQRPYLLRAIYEWILHNGCTPHLIVSADRPGVVVPREFVTDGKIVLNISPGAVRGLVMGDEAIVFSGRFSGSAMDLTVPISSIVGIYARENGQGMVFEELPIEPDPPMGSSEVGESKASAVKRPSLKIVK